MSINTVVMMDISYNGPDEILDDANDFEADDKDTSFDIEDSEFTNDIKSSLEDTFSFSHDPSNVRDSYLTDRSSERVKKIERAKKSYVTSRLGIFEITGIIAHRFMLLEKGSFPLLARDQTFFDTTTTYEAVIHEIEEGVCPVVIKKAHYYMKLTDYPKDVVEERLRYIAELWKAQGKLSTDFIVHMKY